MQRQNVLNDQLRWVALITVDVLLDVEAKNLIALGKQPFRPPTKSAKQIYRYWFHFLLTPNFLTNSAFILVASSRSALVSGFTPRRRLVEKLKEGVLARAAEALREVGRAI